MKIETAAAYLLLTTDEGVVHAPFTLYLNQNYINPHTRMVAARALRVLLRLVDAFDVDISARALEGRCLTPGETVALRQLAYFPIEKIEVMSDNTVRMIASAQKEQDPSRIAGTVAPNTAYRQLLQIADFLEWYCQHVLDPRMALNSGVTDALRRAYALCVQELKKPMGATKATHSHQIKSLPHQRFLDIYTVLYNRADDVLQTESGKRGANLMRDRAIVLMAAEGLRPGAIGNIALADFKWRGGKENGYVALRNNTAERVKRLSSATPTQKGSASSQGYNSTYTISIWPTTAKAIREYIDGERQQVLSKGMENRSKGFLFLADHGGPIGDRGTISTVFERAGTGLRRLGLLTKSENDPYLDGEEYDFYAYVLRHSAASFFYSYKSHHQKDDEVVKDRMNERFGWSRGSEMANHYAARAVLDDAIVNADEFIGALFEESRGAKSAPVGEAK